MKKHFEKGGEEDTLKTLNDIEEEFVERCKDNSILKDWGKGYNAGYVVALGDVKANAVKDYKNIDEFEFLFGLLSPAEKRVLMKYIKWKNNLTSEDLQ